MYERAEKADPYFCGLIENIEEQLAYEAWIDRWRGYQLLLFIFSETGILQQWP